jgi:hypothetical protein
MAIREKGRKPGRVVEVSFRPAEAGEKGLVSETHTEYHRGGSGGGPMFDVDHETGIHPTMESAKAHLEKSFGGHFGSGDGPKESKPEPEDDGAE